MKLKKAILQVLKRDTLKAIVDDLEIGEVDRRRAEEMSAALSRAHRATPKLLLEYLSEGEVKQACELVGISSTGRRAGLIEELLKAEAGRKSSRIGARERPVPIPDPGPHLAAWEPRPCPKSQILQMSPPRRLPDRFGCPTHPRE